MLHLTATGCRSPRRRLFKGGGIRKEVAVLLVGILSVAPGMERGRVVKDFFAPVLAFLGRVLSRALQQKEQAAFILESTESRAKDRSGAGGPSSVVGAINNGERGSTCSKKE